MSNKDCFAYRVKLGKFGEEHPACRALSELVCENKYCSFYRHKSEVDTQQIEHDINCYNPNKK